MRRGYVAVVLSLAVIGVALVAGEVVQGYGTPAVPPCSGSTSLQVDRVAYWGCTAEVNFAPAGLGSNTSRDVTHTLVNFHHVSFDAYGYFTMECPVLSVSGMEANGSNFSLLIYMAPTNCRSGNETVLTSDSSAGAIWTGQDANVTLLVREG